MCRPVFKLVQQTYADVSSLQLVVGKGSTQRMIFTIGMNEINIFIRNVKAYILIENFKKYFLAREKYTPLSCRLKFIDYFLVCVTL